MTIDELYKVYGRLQGQVAAAVNVCAMMAALHPARESIERILEATATSANSRREGTASEQAYAAGVESTIEVFRAALAGVTRNSGAH